MNSNGIEFFKDVENRDKRHAQLRSTYEYLSTCRDKQDTTDESWKSILTVFDCIPSLEDSANGNEPLENRFNTYLLSLNYPCLDVDDNFIEMYIRYSIIYLEDYNYDNKLIGLHLLDHFLHNLTPSKLVVNMRADLIYNTLFKYVNDKDSCAFLCRAIPVMRFLLDKIETKYSRAEHCYAKHSIVVDAMLSSCYMSTDMRVKTIYMRCLGEYLSQMSDYSCRHLDKYLTVAFDFLDSVKVLSTAAHDEHHRDRQIDAKQELAESSVDLIACIVETCGLRIHAHARRILNFCIKILYMFTYELSDGDDAARDNTLNDPFVTKVRNIIVSLFKSEVVRAKFYDEFSQLKTPQTRLNKNLVYLIQDL
jgi:hypothetical protein